MADKEVQLKISADADQARAQLDAVGKGLDGVAAAAGATTAKADAAAAKVGDIGKQAGAINQTEAATGRFATTTDWLRQKWQQTAGTVRDFAAGNLLAEIFKNIAQQATELVRAFIATNEQVTGLRRAFTAIYKDAQLAEQQIAFLRKTSNDAGVGFAGLSDSFKSFTASATAANIPLAVQNDLFASVAKAGATLGLSTAETSRAVLSLSHMASKGVVSMEELRQQLGESLPGALSLSAKGLGLTEAELIKLVESGGLAARDLFPALAASLKTMAGENDTLTATWERLKNAMAQAFVATGDGGGMQVLIAGARTLAGVLGLVLVPLQGFAEALFGLGRTIGAVAASMAIMTDRSTTWAQKAAALKGVASDLSDSFAAAGGRISATTTAFKESSLGADKAAASATALKSAADQSSAAAAGLSQSWTSIGQAMAKAATDMAQQAANADKHAQAVKSQGAALVELARIQGDHAAVLQAEQKAAQNNAVALEAVAKARGDELAIVQAELTAKQNLVAGNEAEQKARAEELKQLTDKVAKLTEEARASHEAAEAAKTAAVARQAAAQANKDHSGQLQELVQKLQEERTALEQVRQEYVAGRANREDVAEAERKVALAAAMVKDAYRDQLKAITAQRDAKLASLDVQGAEVRLAIEQQRTIMEVAKARGNEGAAIAAQREIRRLEIQLLQLTAEAKRAEADAAIAAAQAKKAELIASGEYVGVKKLEIDAAIKAAEVKRVEGQIAQETANRLWQLGDAQDQLGTKTRKATGDLLDQVGALEKLGAGVQKVGEGYRNAQGFTSDAQGNTQQQFVWTRASIIDYLKQAGLNDLLAQDLAKQFLNGQGQVEAFNNQGQIKWGGKFSTMSSALGKMADFYKNDERGQFDAAQRLDYLKKDRDARLGNATSGNTYVSNVTIDGRTTPVRFADRESQSATESLLRDLANAKRRAA